MLELEMYQRLQLKILEMGLHQDVRYQQIVTSRKRSFNNEEKDIQIVPAGNEITTIVTNNRD